MPITQQIYKQIFSGGAISITEAGLYAIQKGASVSSISVGASVDAGTMIKVGSNVTVSGTIDLDGDRTTILAGPNFNVTGLTTVDGARCTIKARNSGGMGGITVAATGDYFCLDGGGHGFLVDGATSQYGILQNGTDCLFKNFSVKTTGGSGNAFSPIAHVAAGTRVIYYNVNIIDSDGEIDFFGADTSILNCRIQDGDSYSARLGAARIICVGNNITNPSSERGIRVFSGGDDCIINSNIIQANDGTFGGVVLDSGADTNIVTGNRIEVAVSDSGTNNTAANNEVATI